MEEKKRLINKCLKTLKNNLTIQGITNFDENILIGTFKNMNVFELKNWIEIDKKLKSFNESISENEEKKELLQLLFETGEITLFAKEEILRKFCDGGSAKK